MVVVGKSCSELVNINWGSSPELVGKYNLGTRAFNAKFLPESVNTSSGQELVDTNWEPGPVAKQMAGGREMQRPFL